PATRPLRLAARIDGSWTGSFTIPRNARPAPAAVTATCVSDGFLSLLTAYRPKTFTVTGSVVPTTPASPAPTVPGTRATTTLSEPGNPTGPGAPTSQVSAPNNRTDNGTPGSGHGTAGSGAS